MAKVELNAPAPDFSLLSIKGERITLSDFRDKSHVLVVFNRGLF